MGADLCSYHTKSFSYLVYSFVYFTSYVVASGDKMEIDLQMKVYSVHDERFRKYGFVLTGYTEYTLTLYFRAICLNDAPASRSFTILSFNSLG